MAALCERCLMLACILAGTIISSSQPHFHFHKHGRSAKNVSTDHQGKWKHVNEATGAVVFSTLGLFVGNATNPNPPKSVIASVMKQQKPLFIQDKPWEPRLDNGYPNVVFDQVDGNPRWQLWYGGCGAAESCRDQFLYYANSTDGLTWVKPNLNRYDLTTKFPKLAHIGKSNNIVMYGGGLGMYKDTHDPDPSKRYKMAGGSPGGCYSDDGANKCLTGTASSPDGINNWTDLRAFSFPKPWRPDCHTNLFYDDRQQKYILTSRDYTSQSGRDICISESGGSTSQHWLGNYSLQYSNEYPEADEAAPCEKLDNGSSFFLGQQIDDSGDVVSACAQRCRQTDGCHYFWVYTKGKENGLCCPKSIIAGPVRKPVCTDCGGQFYIMDGPPTSGSDENGSEFGNWSNPVLVESGTTDHQLYSQITFPFYDVYLGIVMIFDATNATGHVHCRLSWSPDSRVWHWVDEGGLTGKEFIPHGPSGSFDSHICFAAHSPIRTSTGANVYFMGGNGPHNGARNSSFGIAKLSGPDRFAGVTDGIGTTRPIFVAGDTMTITMDGAKEGSSVVITVVTNVPTQSEPIRETQTDGQVRWNSTVNPLTSLVGMNVTFRLTITDATVWTIGFK